MELQLWMAPEFPRMEKGRFWRFLCAEPGFYYKKKTAEKPGKE